MVDEADKHPWAMGLSRRSRRAALTSIAAFAIGSGLSRLASAVGVLPINYIEVLPTIGTAGMPTRAQFEAIRKAGYRVVVNLAPSHVIGAHKDEAELVAAQGLLYHHIPVDFARPTAADVQRFAQTMNAHREQRVFVHCQVNMRASVFTFLYRATELGEDPDHAYTDVLKVWQPHKQWQQLIRDVLAERAIRLPMALG